MKISLVIPVLNEADNIFPLYEHLNKLFTALALEAEYLFIDDGSTDNSYAILKDLHQKDPSVKGLSFSRNFGHQAALTAGLDMASGDAVVLMDGDFQHPPEVIPEMINKWREGFDIVYTIRTDNALTNRLKASASNLFYTVFRLFSDVKLPSHAADFRLLDRKVVTAFHQLRERTRFLRGLTAWVGYRTACVSYIASDRRMGRTKYTWARMAQLALDGLVSFSAAPLYAAIFVGFLLSALGVLEIVYALWIRFFTTRALPGWTSLIIFISLIGGIQLLLLGVCGVYIAKIYDEIKQRPLYLIRESLGLSPNQTR